MKRLSISESRQHQLNELGNWFKMNPSLRGSNEWNEKIEEGADIAEALNDC